MLETDSKYLHKDLTDAILGVFYQVYNELGYGFLESIYQSAMEVALRSAGFAIVPQAPVPVWFRGSQIGDFKADILVNSSVLLELKAARTIESAHEAQLLNYLRATKVEVGLILNFGPRPQVRRLVFGNDRKVSTSEVKRASAPG